MAYFIANSRERTDVTVDLCELDWEHDGQYYAGEIDVDVELTTEKTTHDYPGSFCAEPLGVELHHWRRPVCRVDDETGEEIPGPVPADVIEAAMDAAQDRACDCWRY